MKFAKDALRAGTMRRLVLGAILLLTAVLFCGDMRSGSATADGENGNRTFAAGKGVDYRLLATNKTSTMQKEMNEAGDAGYRFEGVMGGETALGGSEVVCIMSKPLGAESDARYEYKLLATTKTSTMQKEMQQAGDAGFEYRGQTVFKSTFGGKEVVVVLERDRKANPVSFEYKLLATSKTSTMQKELGEAGGAGFSFVGITVASTAMGGSEVLCDLSRDKCQLSVNLVAVRLDQHAAGSVPGWKAGYYMTYDLFAGCATVVLARSPS